MSPRRLVVVLVAVAALSLSAAFAASQDGSTPRAATPDASSRATPTNVIRFEGSGNTGTETVVLNSRTYRVTATCDTDADTFNNTFALRLIEVAGGDEDRLLGGETPFDGSVLTRINGGVYGFNVSCSGD